MGHQFEGPKGRDAATVRAVARRFRSCTVCLIRCVQDLFRGGMTLVEESAAYLDGPGRAEPRRFAAPRRWLTPPKACA